MMYNQNRKISSINLFNSTRFFILAIALTCLTFLICNSVALNFTIICMTNDKNDTNSQYSYTPIEQGWLFSIIAVGNIAGTLILPYLLVKFSMRTILTVYGLISGIATLLTPLSAYVGYVALLIMRFLQGFAMSMCFTALGSITSQWASLKESGFFLATLSIHFQIGNSVTMPVAGALCESSWGWPSLYYLLGILTLLSNVILYFFYRDSPHCHRFVSEEELLKIEEGKVRKTSEITRKTTKVPYKSILTDYVSWGILISITCIRFGFLLFMLYGPVYLNKVLKFDIRSTGFSASLPYISAIFVIIGSGQISDRTTCVSMKVTLKLLVTIASFVLALGNLSVVFLTAENSILVQIAFNLVVSFSGMCFVGTVKSLQMISQHFAPIMMVFMTIGACLSSIILPIVIALLAPDNTQGQWRIIFIGVSVIIFIGMLIFDLTAEAESRPWVKQAKTKNKIYTLPTSVPNLTSSEEDKIKKNMI